MTETIHAASLGAEVHLLIHAHLNQPIESGRVASALRSLRAWMPARQAQAASSTPRTQVQIEDLQGHRLCSWDDAGSLLDVPLRAGVYRVTVSHGAHQRRYTVSLDAGETVNLHVRMPQGTGGGR